MTRAALIVVAIAGCASAPPGAARIETSAELGEARVVRIDGAAVIAGNLVHVPAGRHRLGVHCEFNAGIMIGDAQHLERELDVELHAGHHYRLEARMAPAPCTLRLLEDR
jgi:hypothetical protein